MSDLTIRDAHSADLPAIVALLAEDAMGGEDDAADEPLDPGYRAGFDAIAADPNSLLLVGDLDGRVVGTFQLSFLPGLLFHGAWRGQIEAVRVAADLRGKGYGEQMMRLAIETCRGRGCRVVQLTSNTARERAHAFYERLGFTASHKGMKLMLDKPSP